MLRRSFTPFSVMTIELLAEKRDYQRDNMRRAMRDLVNFGGLANRFISLITAF